MEGERIDGKKDTVYFMRPENLGKGFFLSFLLHPLLLAKRAVIHGVNFLRKTSICVKFVTKKNCPIADLR